MTIYTSLAHRFHKSKDKNDLPLMRGNAGGAYLSVLAFLLFFKSALAFCLFPCKKAASIFGHQKANSPANNSDELIRSKPANSSRNSKSLQMIWLLPLYSDIRKSECCTMPFHDLGNGELLTNLE